MAIKIKILQYERQSECTATHIKCITDLGESVILTDHTQFATYASEVQFNSTSLLNCIVHFEDNTAQIVCLP